MILAVLAVGSEMGLGLLSTRSRCIGSRWWALTQVLTQTWCRVWLTPYSKVFRLDRDRWEMICHPSLLQVAVVWCCVNLALDCEGKELLPIATARMGSYRCSAWAKKSVHTWGLAILIFCTNVLRFCTVCVHNTQSATSVANPATDDSENTGLPRVVQKCPLDLPRPLASARCACARWPLAVVLQRRPKTEAA